MPPSAEEVAATALLKLEAARLRVSTIADGLATLTTIKPFDEKMGVVDYRRWYREILQSATNAGEDFKFSLLEEGEVTVSAAYTEEMAKSNDIDAVPERTIPQIRQVGLLALIRATLVAGGESHRLIEACQSAGGKVNDGTVLRDQAVLTLNSRWSDGSPDMEEGADAKTLYQTKSPWRGKWGSHQLKITMFLFNLGRAGGI
jgi:hypothetical protein